MRHTKTIRGRHMVSKTELIAQLDNERQRAAHLEYQRDSARADAVTLRRDNMAHREREASRMRRDHAEQQRKRQEAEREDKRKRRQELSDGMLRIRDAFEWSFEHKAGETPVLNLSVALDGDTYPIVQGVVDKLNAPPRDTVTDYQRRIQDAINKMSANVHRAQDFYTFLR